MSMTNLTKEDLELVMKNQTTQTRALALHDIHARGDMSDEKYINEIESLREELEERNVGKNKPEEIKV